MLMRLSLRFKITVLVVTMVAIASAAFFNFAYSNIGDILTNATGFGVETAAEALSSLIDTAWLQGLNLPSDTSTQEFHALEEKFAAPIHKGAITRLDVLRIDPVQRQATHVISLPEDGSSDYFEPGGVESLQASVVYGQTSAGHLTANLNAPGYFMVGWAPIKDGQMTVGLLIVAVDVSSLKRTLDTVTLAIGGTMLVLVLLSGIAAFKFATTFEKTAVTDGLMGIYNHKYFKQRLEEEAAKSRRYKQQTALVLLDIDFFKRVNDTYGHATGDIVLKNLAKWVTEGMRNTDVVARYGGEEIAIILPHTSLAGAQEFAERLRIKVSQQVVRDPEEKAEFRVTVSVGVAQWEQGMTSLDLIKRADAALYHSKHMGRNRVTIYQEEILPPPETQTATKS